ncbi:hypothetical protein EC957_003627 [Mortierella hygrophila]|uniref:Uncharacterized protein n=1 Tax=Mortierella hygrophila TaxID=979708 RepID=A0A9P6F2X9_9FUNG|nr:hypothetical protein EC957_003627 [Mortierella hygrophila]
MYTLSPSGSEATTTTLMAKFDSLAKNYNGRNDGHIPTIYCEFSLALFGFYATLKDIQVDLDVAYIEQGAVVNAYASQPNPPTTWGPIRISQHVHDLTQPYYNNGLAGAVVTAYTLDTSILTTHGRARRPFYARSHRRQDLWIAKKANLVGVKILSGTRSDVTSDVVGGIDWVAACVVPGESVVKMSLGGGKSKAIDSATARLEWGSRSHELVPTVR